VVTQDEDIKFAAAMSQDENWVGFCDDAGAIPRSTAYWVLDLIESIGYEVKCAE
jgi:hypothetical protein